jgi:hypothetical protein
MRRALFAVGFLAAVLSVAASPQSSSLGSIEGTVVKLGSGEPLAGINIEMRRVEGTAASPLGPSVFGSGFYSVGAAVRPDQPNPSDIFYARTNDAGRFTFANLKPGKYRLLAAHPQGLYYPAEYGQRNPRGAGYVFAFGDVQTMRVRIEMSPMASVTGRVIGADGQPASHAHVFAAEIAYQNGTRILNQVQAVQSDDRGDYRLFWLPPGRYYVGAFPEGPRRSFYSAAFGPPGSVDSVNQAFPASPIHYALDQNGAVAEEVYELVYAPGDTNLNSARMVDLRSNSSATAIDISLASGRRRAVKIRGVVIDGATGQPAAKVSVRATPRKESPVLFVPDVQTDANGAFEINGVIPGSYYVTASAGAVFQNNVRPTAVQTLDIGTSGADGLRLVLSLGFTVSARVSIDGQASSEFRVGLSRDTSGIPFPQATSSGPGLYSFSGVHPGEYRVTVTTPTATSGSPTYVRSVRYAGVETTNRSIVIGDSPTGEIEVVMGRSNGVFEGQVLDGRSPAANALVVLVPTGSYRTDLYKTATTDSSGSFRMQGVAPGNYVAVAAAWLPPGSWQHPEFLRAVQEQGKSVTISDGASSSLNLTMLSEVVF